jgi:hypothetical protein
LQEQAPVDEGNFPYRLALKNLATDELLMAGSIHEQEWFRLVLQADEAALKRGSERRYVYIFALDRTGASTLIFPRTGQGNVENRVPYDDPPTPEILLNAKFQVGPPFGLDTYLLLTSQEALPQPEVLEWQGVLKQRAGTPQTPLEQLLSNIGLETRGISLPTPVDWSIHALSLKSVAKE